MNTKPRIALAPLLGILFLITASRVLSGIITFNPSDESVHLGPSMASDQWKKNPNSLVGRTIVSPRLFIQNLVNWEVESNDLLYVRLLNDTKYSGVNTYEEMEATGDYFGSGLGILPLVRYKDLLTYATTSLPKVDEPSRAFNFSQSQIATLMSYVGDGTFVMSIDPDCGFFSNDVQFLVNIAPPPPPDPTEDDDEE